MKRGKDNAEGRGKGVDESEKEEDRDPYAYTSGDSEPERELVFWGLGELERKMWIEQLWWKAIAKSKAGATIIRTLNDLNNDIYLYGR